jgi:hypothetical protein
MVPKAGFEPARFVATTPSRWRVYQFHHFGIKKLYYFNPRGPIYNICLNFYHTRPRSYQYGKSFIYLVAGAAGGITGGFAASGLVAGSVCPLTGSLVLSINEVLLWLAI